MSVQLKKIDHIGIAVENLQASVSTYRVLFGREPDHWEEIPSEKVRTAFFALGESSLELLEATDPESPIAKFIARNGRGGIHHICVEVDDIFAKLKELKHNGVQLIDDVPKKGAHNKLVAFVHPKALGGVLLELSQKDHA